MSKPEQLMRYVRSIPEFKLITDLGRRNNHIGATVADAILQANNNYETNVKPRIERILKNYAALRTTNSVLAELLRTTTREFLGWNGQDRARRFEQVLKLFQSEQIESEEDLLDWLSLDSNLPQLRAIKGIGPKTVDYFKILVGISTSAIDTHLFAFLEMAGLTYKGYDDAQSIVNSAADLIPIDRACFDHSIWQHMSQKAAKASSCKR